MTLNLQLAIPIMAPLWIFPEQRQLQENCLRELTSLTDGLRPFGQSFGNSLIYFRVVPNPADEPLLHEIWTAPYGVRDYSLLLVEIDGRFCFEETYKDIKEFRNTDHPDGFSLEQLHFIACDYALSDLYLEANIVFLVANLVRPGSLTAIGGHSFVNREKFGTTQPFFAEGLNSAVEASKKFGWPSFSSLNFEKTWQWLKQSGALEDGMGIGRLGRAIAALSHLTTATLDETSSIDLVWTLLGLEALYSKGNVGLKEQLLGKTEAILGPRTENKKAFAAIYDFRSRLVHGDVDIPLRFTEHNAVKKYEDFYGELSGNEGLALATFIATLQRMAEKNLTSLDFDYALKTSK